MLLRSVSARSLLGMVGVVAIVAAALVVPARAQTPTGEISGVVSRPERIGGAGRDDHAHQRRDQRRPRSRDQQRGTVRHSGDPPGTYTLKAEISGFRVMERRDIEVQVGSSNRIPITLEVGDLTETVEIRGGAPLIQSRTPRSALSSTTAASSSCRSTAATICSWHR